MVGEQRQEEFRIIAACLPAQRLQVALRLPLGQLGRLVDDPHREVRIRVAQRADAAVLAQLQDDEDPEVRRAVRERSPQGEGAIHG